MALFPSSIDTNEKSHGKQGGEPITFDEYLSGTFSYKGFNGTWWSNNEIQWEDDEGNLVLWNIDTGETTILVSKEMLDSFGSGSRFMSFAPNDANLELFASDVDPIYRHSFLARYDIFNSQTGQKYFIAPNGMDNTTKLQYATWLPSTNPSLNRLVYVFENNIYIRERYDDPDSSVQITTEGVIDVIYMGVPDWVFEEEILATNTALYPSPNGDLLAYAKFDDTEVPEFHFTKYGDPRDPIGNQYPKEVPVKYPKVGTTNPTVELRIQDLNDLQSSPLAVIPPTEVSAWGDFLYTAADWTKPG